MDDALSIYVALSLSLNCFVYLSRFTLRFIKVSSNPVSCYVKHLSQDKRNLVVMAGPELICAGWNEIGIIADSQQRLAVLTL